MAQAYIWQAKISKIDDQVVAQSKLVKAFEKRLNNLPDGTFRVVIEKTDKTKAQNDYYWSMVTAMARQTGNDENEMHEALKDMFLPADKYITRIISTQRNTTKGLTKDEFSNYIEACAKWSAEHLNFVWEDPEEYKHNINY